MKKNTRKILLTFGSITATFGTVASVVACSNYQPSRSDLSKRNFLSGKYAYNKTLADYYQSTVAKMFVDKSINWFSLTSNHAKFTDTDLSNLKFDTYQWTIEANAIKDPYYWATQKNTWIKDGTFIDTSKGSKLTTADENKTFVQSLFETDIYDNAILKKDSATFTDLGGGTTNGDKGSGVIMDVDRTLYSMAYLLLTNKTDVQNWLIGDPNDPDKKGEGKLDPLEKNDGQYFFIDYLRQSKPFIMWKNEVKNPSNPTSLITLTNDVKPFNDLSNTLELVNSKTGTLELDGVGTPEPFIKDLWSYAGLQTTNPFTKDGESTRSGDIDPDDAYMEGQSGGNKIGGKQGWLNNKGEISPNGDAVHLDTTTIDFAYIQQLLPGYDDQQFTIPDWMTSSSTNNGSTSISSIWNVAFQIIFYGGSTLDSAKNYWVNHGYDLKVHIPVLENNLGPEHIYE